MRLRIPYLLLLAAAAAGCSKSVLRETDYVLKPLVQASSGDVLRPVEGALAYAFDADTAAWTVASYDDALAGIVTSRTDPSERIVAPYATAEPLADEPLAGRLAMHLTLPTQLILAVDPADRLYAFTQLKMPENLPALYVTLLFKPYREGREYKEGDWIFRNDFYAPPVELPLRVLPARQDEEGGPETLLDASTSALRVYAYAADTTLWRVASYQDALGGVITSKADPDQRRDAPNFIAYPDDGEGCLMTVSDPVLMLVVADRTAPRYAYRRLDVDLEGDPLEEPVVFRTWRRQYLYVDDGGWRIVDEAFQPAAEAAQHPQR